MSREFKNHSHESESLELRPIEKVSAYLYEKYSDEPKEVIEKTIEYVQDHAGCGINIKQQDGSYKHIKDDEYLEFKLEHLDEPGAFEIDHTHAKGEYEKEKKIYPLSSIIDGAQDEIMPSKEGEIPEFFYHGTHKVGDLLSYGTSKETISALRETFQDKTVIDIGAGQGVFGLRDVADPLGAKNYIAVEPVFYKNCFMSIDTEEAAYKNVEKIHISKADMLTFMKGLPDRCKDMVILMSGIDELILSLKFASTEEEVENRNLAEQYLEHFWKETKRVLVPGDGRIIIYTSVFPPEDGFKLVFSGVGGIEGYAYIYEREDEKSVQE